MEAERRAAELEQQARIAEMRVAELDQAAHEAEDRYHELQQDWEQVLEMSEQHE